MALFVISISSCFSWVQIRNKWKIGNFKKFVYPSKGKIQYLNIKEGGKYISFYDNTSRKIVHQKLNQITHEEDVSKKNFIIDLDSENLNNHTYSMVAFFNVKTEKYHVTMTDSKTFSTPSVILRCFLIKESDNILSGLIVTQSGQIFKILKDSYKFIVLPISIFKVELFDSKLFILDSYHTFTVICPITLKTISYFDLECNSPIVQYHIHNTQKKDELRIVVALQNKTVKMFTLKNYELCLESQFSFNISSNIINIYCDEYKCIIVSDNNSIEIYDSNTGELWSKMKSITDSNYCTRLFATHKLFTVDGTKGFTLHKLNDTKGLDMEELSMYLGKKEKTERYLSHLYKTPIFGIEQLSLNWSMNNHNKTKN